METRAHHVIIGAFAIGIFLFAMGFVLWLSKSSIDREFAYYDIVFNEAVTGLSKGGTVQYNGIKVGEVAQLSLAKDDPRKVIARVRLDSGVPVKEDTRAKLGLQGVTGVAFIQLSGGAPASPPLKPTPQNPVPVIPSEESALSKLLASGSDIITSANDLLLRANEVLSRENVDRISKTLENLEGVTGTVNAQREDLGAALKQLSGATGELKHTLVTLDSMATTTNDLMKNNARQVLESTNKALESVDRVASATNSLIGDNRAAISEFSEQGLRQLGPAIVELRETLRSLRQVADRLSGSNSVLLGRDQPKEFEPR
ncbi:MAG TPA: MlaD family protein [Rhodanobacteraceae bacterium]|jgi:phospholipid/cholesterol/gamma-HCH transport system substrate-binding protein|nr:MlaD family protein [Rhodanobacteraceae bacterium]